MMRGGVWRLNGDSGPEESGFASQRLGNERTNATACGGPGKLANPQSKTRELPSKHPHETGARGEIF